MSFQFYSKAISKASKNVAVGFFLIGLLLIGVGFLIWVLKEFFALLFALLFMAAGVGCGITAVKIFWTARKISRAITDENSEPYRENVHIHIEENHE
jgi:cobalamin biosynthesis protein CobD/CbiB